MDFWTFEDQFDESLLFCGVDEVGRGPLAGPVYAAAVILPRGVTLPGLRDSKKLSHKKREMLYPLITEACLSYGVAAASVEEIEAMNIENATFLAMRRAISKLCPQPELALVDGNRFAGDGVPSQCIIGGDNKCPSIAAASVLAKVERDRYMIEQTEHYPDYAFEKHKGYGTKLHIEKLIELGPSPIHRMSFLKKFYKKYGSTN